MKKVIYNKIDKRSISNLPKVLFPGRIVVVTTENDADKAVDFLLAQPILGVDTETRPAFKKGINHKVALLQVATHDICFLFRLNYTGITTSILKLLEDTTVPKIGLSLHDDIMSMHRRADFRPGNFIDLQKHVGEIGIEDLSLQKLYANFFGQKISKAQRLSNWEADILTQQQKNYAATDAWACIMLYEELQKLEDTGDYELVVKPEEEQKVG
ncbi:3'-5' exonuclease [Prevotella sp.]|uniref:3'-5' exonuclease n=1 Tax=uncultured Prevotella sp. TaxID=159272 RepID=UPI0026140A5E|nr:3'-5' exonuclease [uncultured Prevotella sp.]